MTIVTVQFDYGDTPTFETLSEVFRKSCRIHMPNVVFHEVRMPAPTKHPHRPDNVVSNTGKLMVWEEMCRKIDDDLILADCDMLAMQSAEHVFARKFDIAMTFRPNGSMPPMNGGIVFLRPTDRARSFMREWLDVNMQMFDDLYFHQKWRNKYLGMNQAAFGYMLENGRCDDIVRLPTVIWNAVDDDWHSINDQTVFVHIKSMLRRAVLHGEPPSGGCAKAMQAWYNVCATLPPPVKPRKPNKPGHVHPTQKIKYRKKVLRGRLNAKDYYRDV